MKLPCDKWNVYFSHGSHISIFDTHTINCLEIRFDFYIRDIYITIVAVFCLSPTTASGESRTHHWLEKPLLTTSLALLLPIVCFHESIERTTLLEIFNTVEWACTMCYNSSTVQQVFLLKCFFLKIVTWLWCHGNVSINCVGVLVPPFHFSVIMTSCVHVHVLLSI